MYHQTVPNCSGIEQSAAKLLRLLQICSIWEQSDTLNLTGSRFSHFCGLRGPYCTSAPNFNTIVQCVAELLMISIFSPFVCQGDLPTRPILEGCGWNCTKFRRGATFKVISNILLRLETRPAQRWVRSKIEAKFGTFCPPPPAKIREGMATMPEWNKSVL